MSSADDFQRDLQREAAERDADPRAPLVRHVGAATDAALQRALGLAADAPASREQMETWVLGDGAAAEQILPRRAW